MDKNKMLIDATHPEETRVVALRNGRVEEFDFESAARKLLRGNIYLAKVTRVEPSLQAAFIDYGGNRHGFLAFNEIHPDYYQIPVADREALKQEEAEAERWAEEAEDRARSRGPRRRRRPRGERSNGNGNGDGHARDNRDDPSAEVDTFEDGYQTSVAAPHEHEHESHGTAELRHETSPDDVRHEEARPPHAGDPAHAATEGPIPITFVGDEPYAAPAPSYVADAEPMRADPEPIEARERVEPAHDDEDEENGEGHGPIEDDTVEQVSSEEDALEEVPERPRRRARQYKIQEVIKRRQIMLVQVVKEERGNKGAALTTYISLAGRYTVLMPNTARGGGISRKITQPQDRKRLKAIAEELDVEEGMGLIIRTAGAARTKQEIKRDYDYLMRLWESVRDLTLSSTAPCVVYEEGNIIKRAIRDLYSKDFDQIVVAGDAAHREAQDFMEMLMPGAGNQVAAYRAPEPLFARYGIERQLNALFSPYVTLRSGGYIVINQTEALVSVDVNSGKSTREFSIEETALNTNLEAAEEIARQLKLRDLAGLIVVDFIDMEEKRNNRNVERRLKDALRHDRARIQVGRISHFGLLEMSRQRLRAGVLEGSTSQCPHCQGTGIIRSIESVALAVLRGLEDQLLKQPSSLVAQTTAEVALYILNHKRAFITEMERRYGVIVRVEASDRMQGANFGVERFATPASIAKPVGRAAVSMESGFDRDQEPEENEVEVEEVAAEPASTARDLADDDRQPRTEGSAEQERGGRRRRRRRGRRDREGEPREHTQQGAGEPAEHDERYGEGEGAEPEPRNEMTAQDAGYDVPEEPAAASEGGDEAVAGADGEEHAPGENGDRRRGRRRGRRGGRARRRDGAPGAPLEGEGAREDDGHAWGIAEVARPGAEQPALAPGFSGERAVGLVGSVEPTPQQEWQDPVRASIVEQAEGAGESANPFAASQVEAARLALTLAGGTPPEPMVAPPTAPEAREPEPAPAPAPAPTIEAEAETTLKIVAPPAAMPRTFPPVAAPMAPSPAATPVLSVVATNGSGAAHAEAAEETPEPEAAQHMPPAESEEPPRPARRGWWQRRFGGAE